MWSTSLLHCISFSPVQENCATLKCSYHRCTTWRLTRTWSSVTQHVDRKRNNRRNKPKNPLIIKIFIIYRCLILYTEYLIPSYCTNVDLMYKTNEQGCTYHLTQNLVMTYYHSVFIKTMSVLWIAIIRSIETLPWIISRAINNTGFFFFTSGGHTVAP